MSAASPALDPSFAVAEEGLARIAGLAPSTVLRRRLERHAPLLPALQPEPFDADPGWAALLDAVTVQETRLFRAASQLAATAGLPAEVLGLDLCRPALRTAEAGRYGPGPPDPLREVPEDVRPWFESRGGVAIPRPGEGTAVAFRRANLLTLPDDLPAFDVILCRNVLIYLLPEARRAVLHGLHARLVPGGLLVLGATDVPAGDLGLRALDRTNALWARAGAGT